MKLRILIYLILTPKAIFAQDIQFSQFYTNVIYSNPAFAGSAHKSRIIFHERIQWPGNDAKFISSMASFDKYISKRNLGYGFYLLNDIQGNRNINSNEIQGLLSYELAMLENKLVIRFGGQIGLVNRTLDYTKLIFPDQISQNGISANINQNENTQTKKFADFSIGTLAYSHNFWFGYSMHHLNEPNQSFVNDNSNLPKRQTFILGYKFNHTNRFKSTASLTPTIHYKTQGKSDQVDGGLFYTKTNWMSGIWYRGIPILKKYNSNTNNESLVFLMGYKFGWANLSYSYDSVISELTKASPFGAHEINLTLFPKSIPKPKKPLRELPCPQF